MQPEKNMNKTFASPFRNSARKEEKKKLAIAKLFALYANAKKKTATALDELLYTNPQIHEIK